jgi:hypothetical protein
VGCACFTVYRLYAVIHPIPLQVCLSSLPPKQNHVRPLFLPIYVCVCEVGGWLVVYVSSWLCVSGLGASLSLVLGTSAAFHAWCLVLVAHRGLSFAWFGAGEKSLGEELWRACDGMDWRRWYGLMGAEDGWYSEVYRDIYIYDLPSHFSLLSFYVYIYTFSISINIFLPTTSFRSCSSTLLCSTLRASSSSQQQQQQQL